jgi:hypothetical protein
MVDSLWMALLTDLEWLAQTGLTVILFVLLAFGVAVLLFGVRDLGRDLWNFYLRLHKHPH